MGQGASGKFWKKGGKEEKGEGEGLKGKGERKRAGNGKE